MAGWSVVAMHEDQLDVDEAIARRLLEEQFPQWRGRPVRSLATAGTVNAIFRVGDDLVARFPLRDADPADALDVLEAEAAAMAELRAVATVPVPEFVAMGEPGDGYRLPWSVQTWLEGHDGVAEGPAGSVAFAADLATFIAAARGADTHGRRFAGHGRGGHLPDHDEWMDTCFRESEGLLDVAPLASLRAMWADLRTLPEPPADVMSHKDLIPPNVLVRGGRLAGVLDTGDFGPADPALDLVGAWHLLDRGPREVLRAALGCGDEQWRRGMAWALQQAMGLIWYYVDSNPSMARWGRRTLERLLEGRGKLGR
jgi:aminoglycoside phosphotransferase (APT) family kinase protein